MSTYRIQVQGATAVERDQLTAELEGELRRRTDGVEFSRAKASADTMDAGAILVAVLAAPAVVELAKGPLLELAKGLADWMRRKNVDITISSDGSKTLTNVPYDKVLTALKELEGKN